MSRRKNKQQQQKQRQNSQQRPNVSPQSQAQTQPQPAPPQPPQIQVKAPLPYLRYTRWLTILLFGIICIIGVIATKSGDSQGGPTYIITIVLTILSLLLTLLQTFFTIASYINQGGSSAAPQAQALNKRKPPLVDAGLVIVLAIGLVFSFFYPYQTPFTLNSLPPVGDKTKADDLYTNIIKGRTSDWKDTFDDAAHSRKDNGWTIYDQSTLGCQLTGGNLIARADKSGAVATCDETATRWSNFAYQIHIVGLDGNWGGIVFRSTKYDPTGPLYRFGINPTRQTFQELIQGNTSQKRAECNSVHLTECYSPFINQNGDNTLAVIAQNNDFYFYINGHFVDWITDGTNASGLLGAYSYNDNTNCTTTFDNAQVWGA